VTPAQTAVNTLLAVAAILIACNAIGWLVARIGQPRVVGELLAGIVLGPSVLGLLLPGVGAALFPAPVIAALKVVAQLGLVLFLLLVGMEAVPDGNQLRLGRLGVLTTASVAVPLLLAGALAAVLHPTYGGGVPVASFVLFFGAAVSVTALPVLARLLEESGLAGSRLGVTALVAAAGNDVVAWILVAVAAGLLEATGLTSFLLTAGGTLALVLVLLLVVRPVLVRLRTPPLWVPVGIALAAAWSAEQVGVHAIFGAFLAGIAMPRDERWRAELRTQLDPVVARILLPVFFAVVGLATRVDMLTLPDLAVFGAVLAVAVAGKVGGVGLTARALGERPRDALTLGLLMNVRGVTEIVVLTVGLELGLIGPKLFTLLVLVAVVTTFMTAPLLKAAQARDSVESAVHQLRIRR
jgi:Kef-type K+ transport system membrane component KefB